MKKCKVCGNKTNNIFNIKFKMTPICENCASSIFIQQAMWFIELEKQNKNIDN